MPSQIEKPRILVIAAAQDKTVLANKRKGLQEHARAAGLDIRMDVANPLAKYSRRQWNNPDKLLKGYDGVLFLGSGALDFSIKTEARERYYARVLPLAQRVVRDAREAKGLGTEPLPTLAICLGHQMLHLANGGEVGRIEQRKETGTVVTHLTAEGAVHPWVIGAIEKRRINTQIDPVVVSQAAHKDVVTKIGEGSVVIGSTGKDPFSLTVFIADSIRGDLPRAVRQSKVVTIQTHPEMTAEQLERAIGLTNAHIDSRLGTYEKNYQIYTPTIDPSQIVVEFFKASRDHAMRRTHRVHSLPQQGS